MGNVIIEKARLAQEQVNSKLEAEGHKLVRCYHAFKFKVNPIDVDSQSEKWEQRSFEVLAEIPKIHKLAPVYSSLILTELELKEIT